MVLKSTRVQNPLCFLPVCVLYYSACANTIRVIVYIAHAPIIIHRCMACSDLLLA